LGLIVDLVHYGTPTWLEGSFTDPDYPEAVAAFAGAVAARYRGRLAGITPLNEPLVTASFVGMRGIWPPHETGESGWAKVVVSIAEGLQRSVRAIRVAAPETVVVHIEAMHIWRESGEDVKEQVALLRAKNYLPTDLLLGRVTSGHPLYHWLLEHSIGAERLDAISAAGETPDVIGLNYYPELSARDIVLKPDGVAVGVTFNAWDSGLRDLILDFHDRYALPILISETAVEGEEAHQELWLEAVGDLCSELIDDGVPVVGVIWWPLFDFVDWSWATGDQVIEEFWVWNEGQPQPVTPPPRGADLEAYFRRMGLYRLVEASGEILRTPTPMALAFRRRADATDEATSKIAPPGLLSLADLRRATVNTLGPIE
jgi:beta-glucosidase/6-phospho-beta-glucosidase/beta-galactosidase